MGMRRRRREKKDDRAGGDGGGRHSKRTAGHGRAAAASGWRGRPARPAGGACNRSSTRKPFSRRRPTRKMARDMKVICKGSRRRAARSDHESDVGFFASARTQ